MMAEIKIRHEIIIRSMLGHYDIHDVGLYELCFLQFRMICELIALGCLAVHGDVPGALSARMREAHQADFILNALEKLHPRFFPEPGIVVTNPDGGEYFLPVENALPKAELIKLYWRCGEVLHRGSFKRIEAPRTIDMNEIEPICQKIADLLKFHRIALVGTSDELWLEIGHGTKVRGTLRRPTNLPIEWQPRKTL